MMRRNRRTNTVGVAAVITTVVLVLLLGTLQIAILANAFQIRSVSFSNCCRARRYQSSSTTTTVTQLAMANKSKSRMMEPEELKRQLEAYLEKRRELNADELAKQEKGKVIGGTKGNKVLDYISGAPVKEQIIETIPNIFDYDELTKYGFSSLVTPIMEMGGRRAVYDLMELPAPTPRPRNTVVQAAAPLTMDRNGKDDRARYSGLKMGQVLDDTLLGEALAQAAEKSKRGETLRPKLVEEDYEIPYSDQRTTGPRRTPEWTPERIDEYTKRQGLAMDWARRARMGDFVQDPMEVLDLNFAMRLYLIFSVMEISLAFGRSTPALFEGVLGLSASVLQEILPLLQAPGLVLTAANVGSCIVCGAILAPPLNRSGTVWAIKGFLGGPMAVLQLQKAEALRTRGETEQRNKDISAAARRQP